MLLLNWLWDPIPGTNALSVTGAVSVTGAMSVTGTVSLPGYTWAAGLVSAAGAKVTSTGQVSWSVTHPNLGLYVITWVTPHPAGANYIVTVTAQGAMAMVRNVVALTSTSFQIEVYVNASTTFLDAVLSSMRLAS